MTHERRISIRAPRTTCKICWCSIFADDDTEWVTTPAPGIAHKICAREAAKPEK